MKIIHTADIHLDSAFGRHFDDKKAEERRNEILVTFRRMVNYAAQNNVGAIIIAGDLFDTHRIDATARDAVISAVTNHPDILFFYLRGNHDEGAFAKEFELRAGKIQDNLKLFGDSWTSYTLQDGDQKIVITGAEITKKNNASLPGSLSLDPAAVNIVTLHGQEVQTQGKTDAEVIPLRAYANKGIDYLALGHIHYPKIEQLDTRGRYAYSGCLEGRGFDETGKRGFYLLNVENKQVDAEFIPFANRTVYDIGIDVKDALVSDEVIEIVKEELPKAGVLDKDMIKIRLQGETDMDADFNLSYIKTTLETEYYYVKLKNETTPVVDYNAFLNDASLKGEFVRRVLNDKNAGNITEDEAAKIIRYGIRLLAGKENLS